MSFLLSTWVIQSTCTCTYAYRIYRSHDHTVPTVNLPIGLLMDECDEGTLWDPLLNAYFFTYDTDKETFTPENSDTPVNWLYFKGKWGDEQLPDDDPDQIEVVGQRKYSSGPTGPWYKALDRKGICPDDIKPCIIRDDIETMDIDVESRPPVPTAA